MKKFFIDHYPIHQDKHIDTPYITFNKIVGVNSLNEYREEFGECIYYGRGFSYDDLSDGRVVLKFTTKWEYPIAAIKRALTLDRSIEWYAVEENNIYVSKFYWEEGVQEKIALLGDDFYIWSEKQHTVEDKLSDEDHLLWYFLKNNGVLWTVFSDDLDLPRYFKMETEGNYVDKTTCLCDRFD